MPIVIRRDCARSHVLVIAMAAFLWLCAIVGVAGSREPQGRPSALTNADVVKMASAGLSDEVISDAIKTAPSRRLDLSPEGLIALKKGGVSDRIIREMQAAGASSPSSPPTQINRSGVTLDRTLAASVIEKTTFFQTPETVQIAVGNQCDKSTGWTQQPGESNFAYFDRMGKELSNPSATQGQEIQLAFVGVLERAGFIQRGNTSDGNKCPPGTAAYVLSLTSQGLEQSRTAWVLVAENTWRVPMARRNLVEVTGIRRQGFTAVVDFRWRWDSLYRGIDMPGTALLGQALLDHFDDGWRVNSSQLRDNFFDGWGKLRPAPTFSVLAVTPQSKGELPRSDAKAAIGTLDSAREATRGGNYAEAIGITSRLLSTGSDDAAVRAVLGRALFESGEYARAVPNIKGAIEAGTAVTFYVKHRHRGPVVGSRPNHELCSGALTVSRDKLSFEGTRGGADDSFEVDNTRIESIQTDGGGVRLRINNKTERGEYHFYPLQATTRAFDPSRPRADMIAECLCPGGISALTSVLQHLASAKR